jgi:hypothetical protein
MERDDADTVLSQYQMLVEMADRVSARRAGANTFFVTINTALVAVFGLVTSARTITRGHPSSPGTFGLVLTAIAGAVLSVTWLMLLAYYRRLNGAKFAVINKIELQLPVKPFTEEWQILNPEETPSDMELVLDWWQAYERFKRWSRWTKHREATKVEQVVPLVFIVIYAALALRVLFR